jgi:Glutamate dehydrogenase/leucine dehydrogenase
VRVDGICLGDLVGGYGVAQTALAASAQLDLDPQRATAVVQGFGSIGGAVARYLARAGVRVVAIADRKGLIRNDAGLDVEALLAARDGLGAVDRSGLRDGDTTAEREAWLDVPCDILVPAAMSYVIRASDADRIQARLVVEGANLPTLPAAEAALAARDIPVVPDFLANVMTNAWWWWVVFGDIAPTAESSFAKIDATTRRLVDAVFAGAGTSGDTLRSSALDLAERNSRALAARVGVTA